MKRTALLVTAFLGFLLATIHAQPVHAQGTRGWTSLPSLPVAQSALSGGEIGRRIYTGFGSQSPPVFLVYDPITRWSSLSVPNGLYARATTVAGGRFYVFGGVDSAALSR